MKSIYLSLSSLMFVTMLCVCFISCGSDEDNGVVEPVSPSEISNVPDPEGTLEIYLNAGTDPQYYADTHSSIYLGIITTSLNPFGGAQSWITLRLALDTSNNLAIWPDRNKITDNTFCSIVSYGKVFGLEAL